MTNSDVPKIREPVAELKSYRFIVDETSRHDTPRVLVCLRHALRDGRTAANGLPRSVSERLQFVWLDREGKAADAGSAPYLDCRPLRGGEREGIAAAQRANPGSTRHGRTARGRTPSLTLRRAIWRK